MRPMAAAARRDFRCRFSECRREARQRLLPKNRRDTNYELAVRPRRERSLCAVLLLYTNQIPAAGCSEGSEDASEMAVDIGPKSKYPHYDRADPASLVALRLRLQAARASVPTC